MKRVMLTLVCVVMVAVALAVSAGAVSADGGGFTVQPQSSLWCRGC